MRIGHWRADPSWRRIDLISDVHLHPDAPRTFAAWSAHLLSTPADAVLILGDLFEVWVGDDARGFGFARQCTELLREASARRRLDFMPGNRDFLLDEAMLRDAGMQGLADPTLAHAFGQDVLLTHGDALCIADVDYLRFRHEVRGQKWRTDFLALPLDERQRRARAMRDASMAHQAERGAENWSDVDADLAGRWMRQAACTTMIHGHTHRPATHAMPEGRVRHVLGDWDFDAAPARARTLAWTAEGLEPMDLAAP